MISRELYLKSQHQVDAYITYLVFWQCHDSAMSEVIYISMICEMSGFVRVCLRLRSITPHHVPVCMITTLEEFGF